MEMDFRSRVAEEFGLECELSPDLEFASDLGFDSLDMLDLVLFIEELADPSPEDAENDFPMIVTVRDAEAHFEVLHSKTRSQSGDRFGGINGRVHSSRS